MFHNMVGSEVTKRIFAKTEKEGFPYYYVSACAATTFRRWIARSHLLARTSGDERAIHVEINATSSYLAGRTRIRLKNTRATLIGDRH